MTVSLYLDHQVPVAIGAGLRARDVDVLTTHEDGTGDWSDDRLLERALELGRVVFTQDDDFLAIAHDWYRNGREFAGIVYSHQLAVTIGGAVHDLEIVAGVMEPREMRNRIEFLPL